MKLLARHITFLPAMLWPTRTRMNFGGGSTLHLQETAIVVEGYLQRLFFPLLDRFFQQALSEWTTVTIPYSRVLHYQHTTRPLFRLFLIALLFGAIFAFARAVGVFPLLRWEFLRDGNAEAWMYLGLFLALPAGVALLLVFLLVRPMSYLLFRTVDGGRAIIYFSISSYQLRREFEEALEKNREASRGRQSEYRADEQEGAEAPLWVLCLMLLGTIAASLTQFAFSSTEVVRKAFQKLPDPNLGVPPFLPYVGLLLAEYLPFLLVAAALIYRGWVTRVLAALAVLARGALPLIQHYAAKQALPLDDWQIYVWPAFHLVLALALLLTVPTPTKGGR